MPDINKQALVEMLAELLKIPLIEDENLNGELYCWHSASPNPANRYDKYGMVLYIAVYNKINRHPVIG